MNFNYSSLRVPFQNREVQAYTFGEGKVKILMPPSFLHSGLSTMLFTRELNVPEIQIISYDAPGWGGWTDDFEMEQGFDINLVAQMGIAVMDYLECQNFNLIGYSYGGAFSCEIYQQAPTRIDRLVLVSGVVNGQLVQYDPEYKWLIRIDRLNVERLMRVFFVQRLNKYIKQLHSEGVSKQLLKQYATTFAQVQPQTMVKSAERLFNSDFSSTLQAIDDNGLPAFISFAREEKSLFQTQAQFASKLLPQAEVHEFNGNHDSFLVDYQEYDPHHKLLKFVSTR